MTGDLEISKAIKGPHGGARPNAGRKPGPTRNTLDKVQARELLRALVTAHLEPMVLAQVAAAKGLTVAVVRRSDGTYRRIDSPEAFDAAVTGGERLDIHTLQPSTAAFTDLLNRALDKPAEQMKVTGADDGPIEHVFRWMK